MAAMTRRGFLKAATAAAGGTLAAPYFVPSSALGLGDSTPPSDRITVGIIGCGIMGDRHRKNFSDMRGSQVVAVCDVNPEVRQRVAQQTPGVKTYSDFREVLARDDIDAVVISTPHHSHAWIAVAAAKARKHIFCEKPLTHTNYESRMVLDTVKRYGRVFEVGTHRRAGEANRLGAELVLNQRIGKLHTIRFYGRPGLTTESAPVDPPDPVPDGFAWDMWLGPAPWIDFSNRGVHLKRRWNQYADFSTGEITLTDCHIIDGAVWAAAPFLKGPVEIEGRAWPEPNMAYRTTFKFAGGVTMICEGPVNAEPASPGVKFEGTDGWVFIDVLRYSMRAHPESLQHTVIGPNEIHLKRVERQGNEWRPVSEDFIRSIKTREAPLCPVEDGHKMTVISNLIWLAPQLARKVKWDDEKERFIDDEDANRWLHYGYRQPWSL